jgi:PAS domain S-box-containing protein
LELSRRRHIASAMLRRRGDFLMPRDPSWARAIINSPGLYAAVIDSAGQILYANEELSAACGRAQADMPGMPALETILSPENYHKVMAMFQPGEPRVTPLSIEEQLPGENQQARLIAYAASLHPHANPAESVAALTGFDITGRAEITEALRRSEAQIRAIVDTAVDAIITIDDRGTIESFNPAAQRIFGYSAAEVLGKNVDILMPEPYHHEHQRYVDNYLRTGHAKIIGIGREVTGLRKDGSVFPMYLAVGEQKTRDGRHFTGIVRDITERKRMEAEILHIAEREQRRIGQDLHDGLGQLLTGAAMVSKAIAQRLKRKSKLLAAEAEKLTALLNDGIAQSRQLARGLQPLDEPGELPNALQELGYRTESMLGIACRIRADSLPDCCSLLAATHLYRIAQEAVNNAVRHGQAKNIEISLKALGTAMRLTIRDDGTGFAEPRGRGLGLRIMDYRARVIGGHLEIRSNPGTGTTVVCSAGGPEPVLENVHHA